MNRPPPLRYQRNLDDDGQSGYRSGVSGRACPGPDRCQERTGGVVLVVLAVVAIAGVTIGLIAGCAIGYAAASGATP